MAKSKIKTHKMASVQRKAIQSAQAKKWDSHWFGRNTPRYGFSGVCPLPLIKEPVFSWDDLSNEEKQTMFKQLLVNMADSIGCEDCDVIPDSDFNGFTYHYVAETGDWALVGRGRVNEWDSQHFTIEQAVNCGFKTDKRCQGFYAVEPEVTHGFAFFVDKIAQKKAIEAAKLEEAELMKAVNKMFKVGDTIRGKDWHENASDVVILSISDYDGSIITGSLDKPHHIHRGDAMRKYFVVN